MHYILLGFSSGLYWLWYFYQRDKLEPEPKKLIFVSYFLGILSAPAHALFSGIWGYALGRYKFEKGRSRFTIVYALILAMLLHALFNFLCIVEIYSSFRLLVLVAVMWSILNRKITKAESDSPYAPISFLGWKKKRKIKK